MIDNRIVGRRISALRQKNGLTQQQLASMMNVSHQAVSKWESGQTLPDIQTLLELTHFFGITIEQLTAVEEESKETEPAEKQETDEKRQADGDERGNAGYMSVQQLLQMAPYMSRETVEEIALQISEPFTAGQIARIAPFVSAECLERIIERSHAEFNWDHLRKIAPFLRREVVDMLAKRIASGQETIRHQSENINKAINDIGKAFDDIGRGMGQAMKKAFRFGENVINEVSAAFNDAACEFTADVQPPKRSERALALRRKAMERALADGNWDWIAAHIEETEGNVELRAQIAEAARAQHMFDWIYENMGEFADSTAIEAALTNGSWTWLGANMMHFDAEMQARIAQAAADAGDWHWMDENFDALKPSDCIAALALPALLAGEDMLAVKLAKLHLHPEAMDEFVMAACKLQKYAQLQAVLDASDAASLDRMLLMLSEKGEWAFVAGMFERATVETVEKMMELAVEQGNFEAVDMLDQYL